MTWLEEKMADIKNGGDHVAVNYRIKCVAIILFSLSNRE